MKKDIKYRGRQLYYFKFNRKVQTKSKNKTEKISNNLQKTNKFSMENGECAYEVLGVTKEATQIEIKKAYRKLALKHVRNFRCRVIMT